jgi:molecular chaperone GrpE
VTSAQPVNFSDSDRSSTPSPKGDGVESDTSVKDEVKSVEDEILTAEGVTLSEESKSSVGTEASVPDPKDTKILALEAENEALNDKLRRYSVSVDKIRSEFDASRSRMDREHKRTLEQDKVKAVTGLLTVLDSFDQALQSAESGRVEKADFLQGIGMIHRQFENALADLGLTRFKSKGERFDPARHEAISMVPVTDSALDGKVIEEMAVGASVGENVVRAAVVVVGKYTASSETSQAND